MTESPERNRLKRLAVSARRTMQEPILRALLKRSSLTETQLETLLIDLVVEDGVGEHVSYNDKAAMRTAGLRSSRGVSRGAFNRTLSQARKNVMNAIYTMLLLAYLGLFDLDVFRPFEEISGKISEYRRMRETLANRSDLSVEEIESYRIIEQTIIDAIQQFSSPLSLKSSIARRRKSDTIDSI